jgi:hypothetical protein
MMAAQLFETAKKEIPSLNEKIEKVFRTNFFFCNVACFFIFYCAEQLAV